SDSQKKIPTARKAGKDKGIQKAATDKPKPAPAPAVVKKKDVSKEGMLGVFGKGGVQDELNKAYEGAGNVAGLSGEATGGAEALGAGTDPGQGLREVGKGGQGTATVGIAGIKTKGRGGGVQGYGTGTLGAKKYASIVAGDS